MHHHCNKLILELLRRGFASACETERLQIQHIVKLYVSCDLSTTVTAAPPDQLINHKTVCHKPSDGRHPNV